MRIKISQAQPLGFRFAALLVACLLIPAAQAQQSEKKVSTFRGRIEQVNPATKRLTVHGETIEGRMGQMTMEYAVDNDAVFDHVKAGDQITAKIFEGDSTLHEGQVIPPGNAVMPGMAN